MLPVLLQVVQLPKPQAAILPLQAVARGTPQTLLSSGWPRLIRGFTISMIVVQTQLEPCSELLVVCIIVLEYRKQLCKESCVATQNNQHFTGEGCRKGSVSPPASYSSRYELEPA